MVPRPPGIGPAATTLDAENLRVGIFASEAGATARSVVTPAVQFEFENCLAALKTQPDSATMAATVTEASAHLARNFARGQQKIYLPNHIITFIRPKPRQPPNMATFVVPLKFNKLDMRDYLFHVYGVKVQAVRSFVNQPAPDRRNGGDGRWYRPRSQKMMIAELVNPFVWPDPPAEGQREAFDFEIFSRIEKGRESDLSRRTIRAKGDIPLRELEPTSRDRKALRKQVREILAGGSGRDIGDDGSVSGNSSRGGAGKSQPSWTSNAEKGEKWVEVEENVKLP